VRQVAFFAKDQPPPHHFSERTKQAIDSPKDRRLYGQRMATVEPVFANLRHNKRLDRFTLRSQAKVNAQWTLYCLVHNIEKLANHAKASTAQESLLRQEIRHTLRMYAEKLTLNPLSLLTFIQPR
jgi:hypothetical protein